MSTYILYKPYLMLSQFTKEVDNQSTLRDLNFQFEKDVYPVGRLDYDSEGLLILSNDKSLNKKLLDPNNKQPKTYWVQIEGTPQLNQLKLLKSGVQIKVKKKIIFTKCDEVFPLNRDEIILPERNPPIRFRKNIPDNWLSVTIHEGKNRQVRKMLSKVGLPVLRLVRTSIAGYSYGDEIIGYLQPGDVIKLNF